MKGKHSRMKSGVPLDELPIIQGWITRESNVVEKLLNKRFGALYPTAFATYRKDTDDSPSKAWPITRHTSLTAVTENSYHLRRGNTSTLWAVARGAYDKVNMWGFTITFGSITSGPDKLSVAFDSQDKADEWHEAFEKVIEQVVANRVAHYRSASAISDLSFDAADATGSGHILSPSRSNPSFDRGHPGSDSFHSTSTSTSTSRKTRSWASVLHINGVAVYVEEQDNEGGGGAVMVSAVVRSPPVDVFRELVKVRKSEGLGLFIGARTLEVVDTNTQVVTQQWKASGLVGALCAPRDVVLLRTWRRDEDGTYIILYQSTTHTAARAPPPSTWSSWNQPVRVAVQAAGFTVAPLLQQYAGTVDSQECLVTLVLKADLGGYLSEKSLVGRCMGPLAGVGARSVLEPVLTSIITIRDKVEQNRFVVRPLSMTSGEASAPGDEIAEQQRRRQYGRTTTLMVFDQRSLVAAQQLEAQRPAAESLVLDAEIKSAAAALKRKRVVGQKSVAQGGQEEEEEFVEALEEEEEFMEEDGGLALPYDDSWAISGTCFQEYWSSPGHAGFKIRGSHYLTDKKKIAAAPPMFELVAVDLLEMEEPMYDICKHLPSVRRSPAPFLFCVQLMVPSHPPRALVCSWAAPMPIMGVDPEQLIAQFEEKQGGGACPDHVSAFFRAFTEFVEGDGQEADKRRNTKFKLIPNIAKGSWIMKQSVGTTPVLLGQKLVTKYYRGSNYFEVDVDIGANSVAASITNLVCGATKSLALDMGVLVEGQSPAQLPEQLIGTVRLDQLDLKTAAYFDETSGRVVKAEVMNKG